MTALYLFVSTFGLVFLLGLQSQNVNNGHYVGAFCTSFGISASQLVLYKLAPDADGAQLAAYIAGGPLGIISSMWAHRRIFRRGR